MMFRLVTGVFLLRFAVGALVPYNGEKIVGGRNTSIEEVPYQVAIETEGDQFCGGSIITTRHILTAGHCFIGDDLTKISIRTGSSLRGMGGTVIKALKVVSHPNYNVSNFDYDVVVIELEEDIELSEASQIIGLADTEPTEGTEALVSGGPSDILQSVTVPVVDHQKCVEFYLEDDETPVTERMICAGGGGVGSCKGDSGGSLVVKAESGDRVVAGITSWNGWHGCAHAGWYGVFTDVANPEIRNFIRDQAGV